MLLTPPDGWAILRTYDVPPGTTTGDVLDFYISELSPEWQWCLRSHTWVGEAGDRGEEIGGAHFKKGTTQVSIDTLGLVYHGRSAPNYEIYVDNEETIDLCQGEELKEEDEASPR